VKKLRSYSPLRYPGGKSQIYPLIKRIIEDNEMTKCIYVEGYAGGAAVAIRLLFEGVVKKIIINDYDRSIYAVWHSILNNTEEFIKLIDSAELTIDEWKKQKSIQKNKDTSDLLTLGFSTLYLNRTNRSGIITAGVIGGYNQQGNYKMDCRFNKVVLTNLIKSISEYKKKIELHNLDAVQFLKLLSKRKNLLYYLDPPYFNKGKELYTNFYNCEDHKILRDYIERKMAKKSVLISYDKCDEIEKLYLNFNQKIIELNYYVETKRKGEEIFITKNLKFREQLFD